jgi:mono/diheme cytochrome c family protein
MRGWLPALGLVVLGGVGVVSAEEAKTAKDPAADRGREAVHGRPALNPALWSPKAQETVWKQWGLAEKPSDYAAAFRERYGLHVAPYDNQGLPMGLHEVRGLLRKGIDADCLLCHAGAVAGQTYIGLGNSSLDLQGLFEEMSSTDGRRLGLPFQFSHTRGTIDPVASVTFLMEWRDAELNLRTEPAKLDFRNDVASKPPAWWLLKRKKTRGWTGGMDVRSTRVDMVNLLNPFNGAAYVKKQESVFADIHAFVLGVEAPRYPFPVDRARAARGRELFGRHCARCHGTYGPDGSYPNKVVGLDVIGTDPTMAEASTPKNVEYFNESWFARQVGPDGEPYQVLDRGGYQAPPLDGVWATAPYFHNGSVPTVYHVLNSKGRPKVYTRSFRTGADDYDPDKLGWKVQALDRGPGDDAPGSERRRVYDTTRPGRGNGGHTFGDSLSDDERRAVIEYLKTL